MEYRFVLHILTEGGDANTVYVVGDDLGAYVSISSNTDYNLYLHDKYAKK